MFRWLYWALIVEEHTMGLVTGRYLIDKNTFRCKPSSLMYLVMYLWLIIIVFFFFPFIWQKRQLWFLAAKKIWEGSSSLPWVTATPFLLTKYLEFHLMSCSREDIQTMGSVHSPPCSGLYWGTWYIFLTLRASLCFMEHNLSHLTLDYFFLSTQCQKYYLGTDEFFFRILYFT